MSDPALQSIRLCAFCGHPMHWHRNSRCYGDIVACECPRVPQFGYRTYGGETIYGPIRPTDLGNPLVRGLYDEANNAITARNDALKQVKEWQKKHAAIERDLATTTKRYHEAISLASERKETIAAFEKAAKKNLPAVLEANWIVMEPIGGADGSDHKLVTWLWRSARIAAVWSGMGFALAHISDPAWAQMGIAVGIYIPILAGAAILTERANLRQERRRR